MQTINNTKWYTDNFKNIIFFGNLISKYLVRKYKKIIKPTILDIGAGQGDLVLYLIKKFPKYRNEIFGFDLVEKKELNIYKGDIKKMQFEDNRFQTIFCTEVLEHLDDETIDLGLKEAFRILRPGGNMICTFPYKEDLMKSTFQCPHCLKNFHKYGHERSFNSENDIAKTFESRGFTVKQINILPLGIVAKLPIITFLVPVLNMLNNPPGFRKRAVVILTK